MTEPLSPNSDLAAEINAIVLRDAVAFANRREAGVSASMNGALDYTACDIIEAVKRHIGNNSTSGTWHPATKEGAFAQAHAVTFIDCDLSLIAPKGIKE